MVSRFWSHGRQLAVVARTGATPVHAGAEAKTQVLYLCEFHRNLLTIMKGYLIPHRSTPKKNVLGRLTFPKDFKFRGTWNEDFLW